MNPSKSTLPHSPFPKYERYKDSGIEWLGKVPEHWEFERVFSAFNERVETGHPDLPNPNITIGRGVQVEEFEGARKKRLIEDLNAYKRAAKGDIAYNTMRMWQGAVGEVPVDGLVSPAYVVAQPIKPINSRFYSYLFRTETFQTETNRHSYGIVSDRNRLYWLGFKNIVIPIPSRDEQDRIVAFLDQKTAEIDALIAKKQRQIELLDEQKAILINRAVTRGLNPNAKLKPSGIEWIGGIPEHWEVVPLKRNANVQTGLTLGKDYPPSRSVDVPYLRVANVQNGHLALGSVTTLRVPKSLVPRYALQECDVLVAKGGDLDKLGRGCVWRSEIETCMHQNLVFAVRPYPAKILPEFLSLALSCKYGQRYFMLTGKQTTNLASTNSSALMNFPVALPVVKEQAEILKALDEIKSGFQDLSRLIESEIKTLKALRSTLIAHAVTGKIKV